MKPIQKWQCDECGELHRYEGDARQCCMPQIMEVWECSECGEIRGTESEAAECCAVEPPVATSPNSKPPGRGGCCDAA